MILTENRMDIYVIFLNQNMSTLSDEHLYLIPAFFRSIICKMFFCGYGSHDHNLMYENINLICYIVFHMETKVGGKYEQIKTICTPDERNGIISSH